MNTRFDPFDPAEWSGQPGCEAFEIALEMRARGALADSAVPVLDAHLAACESCRAHAAATAGVDAALRLPPLDVDWQKAHERMTATLREHRRTPWRFASGAIIALAVYGAVQALFGLPLGPSMLVAPFVLFLCALLALAVRASSRRMARELEHGDVIALYRRSLERAIRVTRYTLPIMLLVTVSSGARLAGALDGPLTTAARQSELMHALVIFLGGVAICAIQWTLRRRHRRALAELR